jgi:hypothetical protein
MATPEFSRPVATLSAAYRAHHTSPLGEAKQSTPEQARVAFVGLPAMAILVALGYEKLKVAPAVRFVLPAIGVVGTVAAICSDVIIPYS